MTFLESIQSKLSSASPIELCVAAVALVGVPVVLGLLLAKKRRPALDPRKKQAFPLIKKTQVSHDTIQLRFKLPSNQHFLGLPIGQHVYVSATIDGKLVSRPYTPVSSDDDEGYFDLVLKVYAKAPPKFPKGGILSQHLDSLRLGDTVDVRGPLGSIVYTGDGEFTVKKTTVHQCTKIGMIAGGTGITPMLQIIRHIAKLASRGGTRIDVSLIFANQTEDDILVRAELEAVAKAYPHFHLWYTLDRPPKKWSYSTGFINKEMIEEHLPKAGKDTVILLCGPPPMITHACEPNLAALGYDKKRILTF